MYVFVVLLHNNDLCVYKNKTDWRYVLYWSRIDAVTQQYTQFILRFNMFLLDYLWIEKNDIIYERKLIDKWVAPRIAG